MASQSSQTSSQPNLSDYLKSLREQSARDHKINRFKRMIFEKNKNPNDYKATDFFPTIPENIRQQAFDSLNASEIDSSPKIRSRKSEANQNALAMIQIKDIQPAQGTDLLSTPITNKSVAKENTLQIELTNTSPVSDPIPPSTDESFDKENDQNYVKKKNTTSDKISLQPTTSAKIYSAKKRFNSLLGNEQQLTPIVNVHKSNRKTLTAAILEDELDDFDDLDENLKKSHTSRIQTRLSSTVAYESPNRTKISSKKNNNKINEEDEEFSGDEEIVASAGEILMQTKQQQKTINEKTINKTPNLIFRSKNNNTEFNNKNLPEEISFAPGNLSKKRDKSSNKTPKLTSENRKKLSRQNKAESEDEEPEKVETIQQNNKNKTTTIEHEELSNKTNKVGTVNIHQEKQQQPEKKVDSNKSKATELTNKSTEDEAEVQEKEQPTKSNKKLIKLKESKDVKNSKKTAKSKAKNMDQEQEESEIETININKSKQSEKEAEKPANNNNLDEYSIASNDLQEYQKELIDDLPINNHHMDIIHDEINLETEPPVEQETIKSTKKSKNKKIEEQQITNQRGDKQPSSSKIIITKINEIKSKSTQAEKQISEDDQDYQRPDQDNVNKSSKKKSQPANKEKSQLIMPPPPAPQSVEIPSENGSAVSVLRRRSSRLESAGSRVSSVKDLDVDLPSAKSNKSQKNLLTQITNMNNDVPSNETLDEQELIQSQNDKFLRKSYAKTINSTTGNNQTVNSSTASSLFKSKQALLSSAQIPSAPIFNSTRNVNKNKKIIESQDENEQNQSEQENSKKSKTKAQKAEKTSKQNSKKEQRRKNRVESEQSDDEQEPQQHNSSKSKRTALKNIDINKQKSNLNSLPSSLVSNEKPIKRSKPQKIQRDKTIIEQIDLPGNHDNDNDDDEMGLRRSKRTKIDKNSVPVYDFEEIVDYTGKKVIVNKLIGVKKKQDEWTKFVNKYNEQYKKRFNKRKMNNLAKGNKYQKEVPKNAKKTKRVANRDELNDSSDCSVGYDNHFNNYNDDHDRNEHNPYKRDIIMNTQDNQACQSLSIDSDISNVNTSQESVIVQDQGTNVLELSSGKTNTENLYCYEKLNDRKIFEECTPGVSIAATSNNGGVLRVEPNHATKTNSHDMRVIYFVQRGECLFSINNVISKHSPGDVIKVPPNIQYKIKNLTKKQDKNDGRLYLFFQFVTASEQI